MLVRLLPPSVFFTTLVRITRSVKLTMAHPPWTSWHRSRNAVLLFSLLQPLASGSVRLMTLTIATRSTSSIHQDTLTLPQRLSVLCVFSTVLLQCLMVRKAWSLSLKPFGVRLISIVFHVFASSTRWISLAQISTILLRPLRKSLVLSLSLFSFQSVLKTTSLVLLT
ncbi:Uncharacterised protein [Chlamydia trachomatis]|nr:Uncharacterised protein [Chlamydia trachomatis]